MWRDVQSIAKMEFVWSADIDKFCQRSGLTEVSPDKELCSSSSYPEVSSVWEHLFEGAACSNDGEGTGGFCSVSEAEELVEVGSGGGRFCTAAFAAIA